jgi:hypothetical protein
VAKRQAISVGIGFSELANGFAGYDAPAVVVSVAMSCTDICVDGSASRRSLSFSSIRRPVKPPHHPTTRHAVAS